MVNKDTMVEFLKNNKYVRVEFTKVDGSKRIMLCTINSDELIKIAYTIPIKLGTEDKLKEDTSDRIVVWDTEKDGWRSFLVANVEKFEAINI